MEGVGCECDGGWGGQDKIMCTTIVAESAVLSL